MAGVSLGLCLTAQLAALQNREARATACWAGVALGYPLPDAVLPSHSGIPPCGIIGSGSVVAGGGLSMCSTSRGE